MEPSKYKTKDSGLQKILDDVYKNGLGIPMTMDTVPEKDKVKTNIFMFNGTDAYIKLPDGRMLKITGVEV
jgi:hypothetical protein